jgi:hypothetical protein
MMKKESRRHPNLRPRFLRRLKFSSFDAKNLFRVLGFGFIFILPHLFVSQGLAFTPTPDTWTLVGLGGYTVYAIAVDPNNANVLYAGTAGAGIFKSTDGGATWNAINNGFPDPNSVNGFNRHYPK